MRARASRHFAPATARPAASQRASAPWSLLIAALGAFALAFALPASPSSPAVPSSTAPAPQQKAPAIPETGLAADARKRLDDAVAAAVVAALGEELGGRQVEMRLDPVSVQPGSPRDRRVVGRGQMRIEDDADWVTFRFELLYDTLMETAGYPQLRLGGGEGEHVQPNDSGQVRALEDRVHALMAEEFGNQQLRLQLDRILTLQTGSRLQRIEADGLVDFGLDGTAPLRVDALYDAREQRWLRVAYRLLPAAP
jgi:hypothetical protein